MSTISLRGSRVGPIAAVLLLLGLIVAIVADGNLPLIWRQMLFAMLALLDAVMVYWLVWLRS